MSSVVDELMLDLRFRTGSYIGLDGRLYQVLGTETAPPRGVIPGRTTLLCENCATEHVMSLSRETVRRSRLVRAA